MAADILTEEEEDEEEKVEEEFDCLIHFYAESEKCAFLYNIPTYIRMHI